MSTCIYVCIYVCIYRSMYILKFISWTDCELLKEVPKCQELN